MKNLVVKTFVAAAVLAGTAGAASAQELKAEIPFSFRAGSRVLPPGEYKVFRDANGGIGRLAIEDTETRHSLLLVPSTRIDQNGSYAAKLVFECGGGNCTLVQMWAPDWAYQFSRPKPDKRVNTQLATIRLSR